MTPFVLSHGLILSELNYIYDQFWVSSLCLWAHSPDSVSVPSLHHSTRRCHAEIPADFIYYRTAWFMEAEAAQGKPILWHFPPWAEHGAAAATEGQGSGSRDKMAFLN